MSIQAKAAKAIRLELKKEYPSVKFSVRSDSYAGGESISIDWTNGPQTDAVKLIVNKYQYGHFNGMDDSYSVSNKRNDIPQVQYIKLYRDHMLR